MKHKTIYSFLITHFILLYASASITPYLTAYPDFIDKYETVSVGWKGIENPSEIDYISLFLSNGLEIIKFPINNTEGYGSASFQVLNMRQPLVFRYMRGIDNVTEVIAESNIIQVNKTKPMHGHLSFTNNLSEMRISWTSGTADESTVIYGVNSGEYLWKNIGAANTYGINSLCWDTVGGYDSYANFIDPGWLHTAVMRDLKPNTKYYYRFGSEISWSEEFSFISSQIDESKGVNILAFGDSGVSECWANGPTCEPSVANTTNNLLRDLNENRYDLLMHIGDLAYAWGYSARWEEFMNEIEPIATKLPYMVGIGNHEMDYVGNPSYSYANGSDSSGECGVPYMKRFDMPNPSNLWYSIDYPLVHITVMSSEHNYSIGSDQRNFLEKDLQSVDHKNKWLLFFGHRPGYCSSVYYGNEVTNKEIRQELEPMLVNNKVDVAFWGHMHIYERSCPVINETCVGDYGEPYGPVHYVIGTGGMGLFDEWEDATWSMFRISTWGFIRIHIPSRESIRIQFVDNNQDGKVIDDVTIYRNKYV